MGCASWNVETMPFQNTLAALPCKDTIDQNAFAEWSRGLGDATISGEGLVSDGVLTSFEAGGCSEVTRFDLGAGSGSKICSQTSLAALCPLAPTRPFQSFCACLRGSKRGRDCSPCKWRLSSMTQPPLAPCGLPLKFHPAQPDPSRMANTALYRASPR